MIELENIEQSDGTIEVSYVFNEYQSEFSKSVIESHFKSIIADNEPYGKEDIDWVHTQIANDLHSIKYLQNLTNPNRRYASDMPKDEDGKLIVDFANPHILENMDYFRPLVKTFNETGKYTTIPKSKHPMSKYVRFWKDQIVNSLEDTIREDGEWIPGELYWYWNFATIYQTDHSDKKSKSGDRVSKPPRTFDGDYLWFHYKDVCKRKGKHGSCLKSRGKGFSIKESNDLARDFILGANLNVVKRNDSTKSYALAESDEFLIKDGILNKFVDVIDWCSKHTEFPKIRKLKDSFSDKHWIMGYKDKQNKVVGSQNEVMGVTLKNDPQKARGKRGSKIKWEEVGAMTHFLTSWAIARPSVEDGEIAFGFMTAFGTGGTDMKDFTGLYTAFYEPSTLNIYGIPNVFDRKASGDKKVGFFFPEYLNRFGCFDENGNSDVIKALTEVYIKRWVVKKSSDPNLYIQEKAERPITPQEAVMRKEGSIFPINDLRVYLENDISPDLNKFVSPHYVGELEKSLGGEVKWKNSTTKSVIRQYPTPSGINKEGCVEIFVQPQKDSSGKIPWGRYIGGIDPYDDDTGTSLGSIFIFDLWTDKIVAEFSGRPKTANEFYEICLRLAEFYNANCNYENNKKGLFTYFSNKNALKYLCDTPQILRDTEYVKGVLQGNKLKGTNATQGINKYARRLLADWMVKSRTIHTEDSDGNNEELIILNLHTIRSVGLIQEALIWSEEGNFDRISAMGMLMILRESLVKITESIMNYDDMDSSELLFDPFFTGNYTQNYIEQSFRMSSKLFGDGFDKAVVSNKTTNIDVMDI